MRKRKNIVRIVAIAVAALLILSVVSVSFYTANAASGYSDDQRREIMAVGETRTVYCNGALPSFVLSDWSAEGAVTKVGSAGESCIIKARSVGTGTVKGMVQSKQTIVHPGYYMLGTFIPGWNETQYDTQHITKEFRVVERITSVSLPSSMNMNVGDSFNGADYVSDDKYARLYAGVRYSSSDSSVLSVENGVFTAKKGGEVTVKIYTTQQAANVSQTCTVKIRYPNAKGVTLSNSSLKLVVGEKYTLTGAVQPAAAKQSLKWESSSPAVTVSGGKLAAKKTGSAVITATANNGKKATCKVTVYKAPSKVKLSDSMTIGVGESVTLKPSISPSGTKTKFKWGSSNKNVATVSGSGKLTGKKAGTATVTVKTYNGKTATCKVKVLEAPSSVTVKRTAVTLGMGQVWSLGAAISPSGARNKISYSSSAASVAAVDSKGRITAAGIGTATVTAKSYNGREASCKVTVTAAPSSVGFTVSKLSVGVGESVKCKLKVSPSGANTSCKWTSSKPDIVSVDSSGKITGKKAGTASITATAYNGKKATCKVTVGKAPTQVKLNKTALKLTIGDTATLQSSLPSGQSSYHMTFYSENSAVATVSASGVVTANAKGTVEIFAKAYNGIEQSCTVTVIPPKATDISLAETSRRLLSGSFAKLKYTQTPAVAEDKVTWTSSNATVATVSADGMVSGHSAGTAVITAKIPCGAVSRCTVTVKNFAVSIDYDGVAYVDGNGDLYLRQDNSTKKLLSDCRSVEYNGSNGAAITNNNDLYMWGSNSVGQLGDGTTTDRSTPVKVMSDVSNVSLGAWCTAIVTNDGGLFFTGCYRNAQKGTTTNNTLTPVKINTNVAQVKMCKDTYASRGVQGYGVLDKNGNLFTCGISYPGNGSSTKSDTYIYVMNNVATFSMGYFHYGAVKTNGDLYAWGSNNAYQIDDSKKTAYKPVKVMSDVCSISMGRSGSFAIKSDGCLYAWGQQYETYYTGSVKPHVLLENAGVAQLNDGCAAAILNSGELYTWGQKNQITDSRPIPIKALTL